MRKASRRAFIRQLLFRAEEGHSHSAGKTLVCIFLRGGADTLNLIVPYGDEQYYRLRPNLAIKPPTANSADAAVRLDDFYGLHPKLRPIYSLFDSGRLAIIQAVGSDNSTGSHFEAQDQIEHGEAYGKTLGGGWVGRYLRTRLTTGATPLSAVAIGATLPESLRSAPTATAFSSLDEVRIKTPPHKIQAVSETLAQLYQAEMGMLGQPGRTTLQLLARVESLHSASHEGTFEYPPHDFAKGLCEIARLVKAEVGIEAACLDLGGWDTHFFQGTTDGLQAESIDHLAGGLAAFDADLGEHRNRVVTLVMTEFGRRIYENGSLGTDHGRGFAMLVIGEGIKGGKIHGQWPGLAEETSGTLGPSGLSVKIDYRSVLAEVLSARFGVKDMQTVFPGFQPQSIGFCHSLN